MGKHDEIARLREELSQALTRAEAAETEVAEKAKEYAWVADRLDNLLGANRIAPVPAEWRHADWRRMDDRDDLRLWNLATDFLEECCIVVADRPDWVWRIAADRAWFRYSSSSRITGYLFAWFDLDGAPDGRDRCLSVEIRR